MNVDRALFSRVFLLAILANVIGGFLVVGILELRARRVRA